MLEHEVVFRCIISSLPALRQLHFLMINNHTGGRKHLPPSRSRHTWISEDLKHSVGETIYMFILGNLINLLLSIHIPIVESINRERI